MKKALIGLAAGVALLGLGAVASANDNDTGGSGMGSSSSTTMKKDLSAPLGSSNELTGTVVKTDMNTVYVEHMGAVIPLKVDSNTKFESASIQRARDLKEGQEIRCSFTINNKTENLAKSISLSSATGGSGLDQGTQPSTPPEKTPSGSEKPY